MKTQSASTQQAGQNKFHANMRPFRSSWLLVFGVCTLVGSLIALAGCLSTHASAQEAEATSESPESNHSVAWEDIQDIVNDRCVTCHARPRPSSDLDFTIPENLQKSILEGDLLERINDADDPMPPSGIIPESERAMFSSWAEEGASTEPSSNPRALDRHQGHGPGGAVASEVIPFDISEERFEFLERMQGHWVGSMELMGQPMPWFAFDYRAIGPAHVHGIFEGGTMGNLFTSFSLAKYKGVETLIARNGGILNGIYRTSYFLLDRVEVDGASTEYRFVDAIGGENIMWDVAYVRG